MTFRDQSFANRFAKMGDQAEGVFEATYPQNWERFGLDRAQINLSRVPEFIRFTPDYLTAKGLVEVQGFGRDQRFKLKDAKLAALREWHDIFRTDLFVWDSHNKRFGWVRLPELTLALDAYGTEDAFDNGRNPYVWIHSDALPVVDEWESYQPDTGAPV
jgi:hypothetical protein